MKCDRGKNKVYKCTRPLDIVPGNTLKFAKIYYLRIKEKDILLARNCQLSPLSIFGREARLSISATCPECEMETHKRDLFSALSTRAFALCNLPMVALQKVAW